MTDCLEIGTSENLAKDEARVPGPGMLILAIFLLDFLPSFLLRSVLISERVYGASEKMGSSEYKSMLFRDLYFYIRSSV